MKNFEHLATFWTLFEPNEALNRGESVFFSNSPTHFGSHLNTCKVVKFTSKRLGCKVYIQILDLNTAYIWIMLFIRTVLLLLKEHHNKIYSVILDFYVCYLFFCMSHAVNSEEVSLIFCIQWTICSLILLLLLIIRILEHDDFINNWRKHAFP